MIAAGRSIVLPAGIGGCTYEAELAAVIGKRAGDTVSYATPNGRQISVEITPSRWALVARQASDLGSTATDGRWQPLDRFTGPVWTDDYSNVFQVLQR